MSERTSPTGVWYVDCERCGVQHPVTRKHCVQCGHPSAFLGAEGFCLDCGGGVK